MNAQNLTISQAMRVLKRLRGELAIAQQRMPASSSWQKGKEPEYKFGEITGERDRLSREVTSLHSRILRTNAATRLQDGDEEIYVSEAILRLAEIKGEISLLSGLNLRRGEVEREPVLNYHGDVVVNQPPLVFESAMSERERDEKVKELKAHFEHLNDEVEKANHVVTVLE